MMNPERLLRRIAKIDALTTCSAYEHGDRHRQDTPPTGDHYNELWDAVMDEIEECGLTGAEISKIMGRIKEK